VGDGGSWRAREYYDGQKWQMKPPGLKIAHWRR